uniref:transposase-like zinc-binding domain-containing protein n=1 Tax=Flavobacterium noncentrifugens TaxID=1128970 RepID=UPI0035311CED
MCLFYFKQLLKSIPTSNNPTSCIKVSDEKTCPYCKELTAIKNGATKNKKQQYHCKACKKRYLSNYTYNAYHPNINADIILFTKEGLGIRSTARILKIAAATLLKRIRAIAKQITQLVIKKGKEYEVDEMCTYVKRKNQFHLVGLRIGKRIKKSSQF